MPDGAAFIRFVQSHTVVRIRREPPSGRTQRVAKSMSLNLVSELLLAANGLNHQDLVAILGQVAV
ncbi:hypothetical protein ACQWFR_26210, partial [Salmonella enterica subsp. enterica serovar Infantis]